MKNSMRSARHTRWMRKGPEEPQAPVPIAPGSSGRGALAGTNGLLVVSLSLVSLQKHPGGTMEW